MKKLEVRLDGEPVGILAETAPGEIFFEYSDSFLARGFSLSPYFLPLKSGLQRASTHAFDGLFGAFSDSLPDGWGLMLMDRAFRRAGKDPSKVSPLDRLAYLGSRALGALTYQPADPSFREDAFPFDLDQIAEQAERIGRGSAEEVLPALLVLGGSPGGARPKILVQFQPKTGAVLPEASDLEPGFQRWMVKFRAKEDEPAAGRIEEAYYAMARVAGITVPDSALFTTRIGDFFASRRFDRDESDERIHTHSFGGLIHADYRLPNLDYKDLLEMTADLTKDHAALLELYRRMAFNVLAHNRDDHVKNFAFQWRSGEGWAPAPAYDLTYSEGIRGQHNMTVLGQGVPTLGHCVAIAATVGIEPRVAREILQQVQNAISQWEELARAARVPVARIGEIKASLEAIPRV